MTGAGVVKFSTLPDASRGLRTHRWIQAASELRSRPGQWGRVSGHASRGAAGAQAQAIKIGRLAAFRPAGAFEAAVRGLDVYARFVGAGAAPVGALSAVGSRPSAACMLPACGCDGTAHA